MKIMSEKSARYITTTLPYVNADPHIGFALELVQADTLARYFRLLGYEVFFSTGTDEHGQKVSRKADAGGEDRQVYVDRFADSFSRLKGALNLSHDNFIRTTSIDHKEAAQAMWNKCHEAGDIYKKSYKGLYCVGCEAFKTVTDLVDGKCPDHSTAPEMIEEENYFFTLSKYQTYLEEYLSKSGSVVPEWRRLEALTFVKGGLEDLSISREKKRMDWGVAVPDDDDHVMYVWFDALTNYISTLGWPSDALGNFHKFWEEGDTLQLAGKDQVRFQSIIWQAMLKSANIKATDKIFYHGFINSGGQKMSKSIGNTISPYELVTKYGTDATRYLLLRHVHPTDDSDITWEKMDEWYTANLVNGLGNLVARVMKMAETHLEEPVTIVDFETQKEELWQAYNFQGVTDHIWSFIGDLDQYIADTEPFKLVKTDLEAAKKHLTILVQKLHFIGTELTPIMPETSKIILEAVKLNKKPENLFGRLG